MWRRRKHYLILFFYSGILAALVIAAHISRGGKDLVTGGKDFLGGARIVDGSELEDAVSDLCRLDFDSGALKWNGEPAPSDSGEETYFLSLDPDEDDWKGTVCALYEGSQLYLAEDEYWGKMNEAVELGHKFTFILANETSYLKGYIVFTFLPTISIDYQGGEIDAREKHMGRITVIDPANDSASSTNCSFHVRGNTSAFYDKKNYRISLKDSSGGKKSRSFLGMREDDDWILNALYTDRTRAREKVCYSLWEKINEPEVTPVASCSMEYAELFMNHEYRGLYGLMMPVDGKLMGMKEGDLLYKVRTWMSEYTAEGELTDYDGSNEVPNANGYNYAEIKYPNGPQGSFLWEPMQAWQNFVYGGHDLRRLESGSVDIDRANIVLHNLFCVLTHAGDNTWKNTFLAAYRQEDGRYTLRETVWDLNYTFGDEFILDFSVGNTVFNAASTDSMDVKTDMDYGYAALMAADPETAADTGALWKKWRQNGITSEYVKKLFTDNEEILKESGAGKREAQRWPGNSSYLSDSFEDVLKWIDGRFDYLDKYYGLGVS